MEADSLVKAIQQGSSKTLHMNSVVVETVLFSYCRVWVDFAELERRVIGE